MRIRVIQKPTRSSIDGIRLDQFTPGSDYLVGTLLGSLMLAEGWAEPAASEEPAIVISLSRFEELKANPPNLVREIFPSYYDTSAALAADRRRSPRRRKRS